MKLVYVLAIFFIVAVAAQVTAPNVQKILPLLASLEARARVLLQRVRVTLAEHRGKFENLIRSLERQEYLVESFALDLKSKLVGPTEQLSMHLVRVLEEDLRIFENRVSQEIANIEQQAQQAH